MSLLQRSPKVTLADGLLLIGCVVLSFYSFFYVQSAMPRGTEVRIEVDGKLAYTLPLTVDRSVTLDGVIGPTTVEIRGGKVRIKEAPCPNKLCIHEGWIERGAIVCLPNRVIVTVASPDNNNGKSKGPDAISG